MLENEGSYPVPAPQSGGALVEAHRAVAEAIAARKVALANPRDPVRAENQILNDCASLELAEEAAYQFARGGTDITGPSIRLLEVIGRRWGNLECGVKELSRGNGYSDVLAYAIDLETGFTDKKEFQVRHWRDTKRGGYAVKDERDIYEIVANQGARRKRACLEAVIPTDLKDKALKTCQDTLLAKVKVTPDLINRLVAKFAAIDVTQEMIEKRIQRKIEAIQAGHVVQLGRIYKSIADDMSQVGDWFEQGGGANQPSQPVPAGGTPSATERMAADLASRKPAGDKAGAPAEPAKKDAATQGPGETQSGASHAAASHPAAAAAEEPTGEITNEFVRKKIAEAKNHEDLTAILMGDLMKLPPGPEREQTTRLWTAKGQEFSKVPDGFAPKETAAAPKTAAAPIAKPHGTDRIKREIRQKMNAAKTVDKLSEIADSITLYAWNEADKKDLEDRYRECAGDLEL